MKRFLMTVCLMVLLVLTLAVPAMAAEGEHTHCICNGTLAGHEHSQITFDTVVTTEEELKTAVTTGTEGTANILLGADITLDEEIGITGKTVNLCLGSHTLTMSGSKARLTANAANSDANYRGTLNITACDGGSIVAASGCRVGFLYTYKGHLNVYGGTVDATNTASGAGGAVIVGYAGDEFALYDGQIVGSLNGTYGGAISCAVAGTVHIAGGTVRDGRANTNRGGNILINHASAVLEVSGGTISGGQAETLGGNIAMQKGILEITGGTITGGSAGGDSNGLGGGGISMEYSCTSFKLSGDAKIYGNTAVTGDESAVGTDVRLNGRDDINVITLGKWAGNGENPKLTLYKLPASSDGSYIGQYVVMFDTGDSAPADPYALKSQFALAAQGDAYQLAMLDATGFTLQDAAAHIHCICGGNLLGKHDCLDITYTAITTADELAAGGNVFLGTDLTLSAETAVGGNTLSLCLHGKTITMETNGRLTANANGGDMTKKGTVNVTACASGSVAAASGCRTGLLYTYKGTLNLYGGTVDASACKEQAGGAVTVGFAEDVFNMYGGTLVANTSSAKGGAIYANNAKSGYSGDYKDVTLDRFVNIYGGTISGTTSQTAGKIHMLNGILTVNGTSVIGGEPVVQDTASVVYNGVSLNGSYNTIYTMAEAVAAAGSTDYIMLPGDLDGQTVSKSVYLDLNGNSLTNLTVNSGAKIYLFDTSAANYTAGTGTATVTGGTVVSDFLTGSLSGYGHNYRFVTVKSGDSYTAHRIYLAVKATSLYPNSPGIYYNTVLRCDPALATLISDYGIKLTYRNYDIEGDTALTDDVVKYYSYNTTVEAYDAETNQDNSKKAGLLNMLSTSNSANLNSHLAHMDFIGNAYIKIGDSTITSASVTHTLQELTQNADLVYANLSEAQQNAMKTMYTKWETLITSWNWNVSNTAAAVNAG